MLSELFEENARVLDLVGERPLRFPAMTRLGLILPFQ